MPTWDANLYLQFANERTQPALDLLARLSSIPDPQHVVDLGCGPGNSTAILRQRWPEADITGLDNSPEMIATARQSAPSEKWLLADAAAWTSEIPLDLIFTNAAIQWMPDHTALMPHLMEQLKPGGVLAVQMPSHYLSPLHQVTLQVSSDPAWNQHMDSARNALTKESPAFYYDALQPFSSRLDLWETEYLHIMESPAAILKWFSGTGLRPFLEALETIEQKQAFERMMLEGYTKAYLPQKDGRILFPFRRLFIIAMKKL